MIKGFVVQLHNLCSASLVFGVAITASMVPYSPVVAGSFFYILGNLFVVVATYTKLILSTALECLVTILALMFELGMTLYQFAWSNHRIERIHVRL